MSKNVAVFVDVANIFYAAKAAGVDRKTLMVHLSCLNRDCAVGYRVEGDRLKLLKLEE